VVTIEHQLVHRRADLVFRCFNQAEAKISRRVFDAVEIARKLAVRRGDVNRTGMNKLVGRFVKVVTKTDRLCESLDVCFIPSQKMPTCCAPARFASGK